MSWLRCIIFFYSTVWVSNLEAQAYLLALPDDSETFNRRITRFNNDDILIGDSSDDGVFSQSNGKVFLTRIDECGNVIWSNSYERTTEYLEFKDVVIDEEEIIFAYGSAYRGGQEMLFLLKVNSNGALINFKLIQTGTIDHFSYSMDIRNGVILLYGLLLDFNTQKEGFISIFDEGLQHLWGKRFAPFESEGDAIINSRGHFVCRSGPFHYVFDEQGILLWAQEINLNNGALPIAGPYEVPGGYVFQAYHDQKIFFYKLDYNGNLVWKTEKIANSRFRADFLVDTDGSIIAVYKHSLNGLNVLCRTDLNNASGQIINHEYLNTEFSIDIEHVYASLDTKGNIRVLGNKVLIEKYPIDVPYFLMQFPLTGDSDVNNCFEWQALDGLLPNEIPLILESIDTIIPDTRMSVLNTEGLTAVLSYEFPIRDVCNLIVEPQIIRKDTLLQCDQTWEITLPHNDFRWEDTPNLSTRILERSGVYRAKNRNCRQPVVLEYGLTRPECTCKVYLPTAFTPNGDNLNDTYEVYSDCDLTEVHLTVYNRWGMKVYRGDGSWDGRSVDGDFEAGLYLVQVAYSLRDNNGVLQVGNDVQQISLIR